MSVDLVRGDPPHLIEKLNGWLAEKEITIVDIVSDNNNCLFECFLCGLDEAGIPRAVRLECGPQVDSHMSNQYAQMLRKVATNGV
jgi:hypothetical protein